MMAVARGCKKPADRHADPLTLTLESRNGLNRSPSYFVLVTVNSNGMPMKSPVNLISAGATTPL